MRGSLIPPALQADLAKQDKERAERAARGPQTETEWRYRFARSIQAELEMARKYNISAETKFVPGEGEVVVKSVREVAAKKLFWRFLWVRIRTKVINFFKGLFRKDQ